MVSFEPRRLFNRKLPGKGLHNLIEDFHAEFGPHNLSPPEKHHYLRLIPLIKETSDVFYLQPEIIFCYLWPDFNLFQTHSLLLRLLLTQLVPVFPEIEYLTDRRRNIRRHFNKIKSSLLCYLQCLARRDNPELTSIDVYQPYFPCPYLFVNSNVFGYALTLLN